MKAIGVVTDSHSGLSQEEAARLGVKVLPMPFYFGEECFFENVSITRQQFFDRINGGEKVSTSQPSPESVMEIWRESLKEYEKILYIPLSSGLSGSCNTAIMLAEEKEFAGRVLVVDNGRVATLLHRSILDAFELISEGYEAEQVKEILEASRDKMAIYVALETLEHLQRGGRISATSATLGTILNIKPILRFGVGLLETYRKCRGMKKARREMLEGLKQELEERFPKEHAAGQVYILAASSADEATTEDWVAEIRDFFGGTEVLCDDLSLGLSCHIGPGGLGVAYSVKPVRP